MPTPTGFADDATCWIRAGEGVPPTGATQEAAVPPLEPVQLQSHGPVPLTVEAEPTVQRFVVGAALTGTPFADPQEPLTSCWVRGAEQEAVLPPADPVQLQSHGPVPFTVEAEPALQRFVVGAVLTGTPFAKPQEPLTTCWVRGAEQEEALPPCDPRQLHAHGPLPLTDEAVPALQRFIVGAVLTGSSFAEPHEPLI
jgi:hypothetical protein